MRGIMTMEESQKEMEEMLIDESLINEDHINDKFRLCLYCAMSCPSIGRNYAPSDVNECDCVCHSN